MIHAYESSPIHVLTLTPFYPSESDNVDGTFVAAPLEYLSAFKVDSTIIAAKPRAWGTFKTSDRVPEAIWVRYPQLPGRAAYGSWGLLMYARLAHFVSRLHREHHIDLIHAHSALPCGHPAALLSRQLRIPFVVTTHGLDVFSLRREKGVSRLWVDRCTRFVHRKANMNICVSEAVRRVMVDVLGDSARTTVIYNGVNTSLFTAPPPQSDNADLTPDLNAKFSRYISQLPSDWDMLLFGGLHVYVRPQRISENISKLTNSYSTFAYALKQTIYDAFIELNSRSLEPVDKVNAILQRSFNCYCFMPHLAWVEENYSDTQSKHTHPWYVKEAVVVASPEWNQIQKDTVLIIAHRDQTHDRSQTRNLQFKLDYSSTWYPHITVLVVEHGERPGLVPQTLPEGVHYKFLRDGNAFNPELCFQAGFKMFESSKEFFIFSESDIHLDRENIIANLELCGHYDFVSSYKHLIELTEEDTKMMIKGEDVDLTGYERLERADICRGSCFFTRKGIQRVGGWEDELQSLKVRRLLSVFESPNKALRLSQANGNHR